MLGDGGAIYATKAFLCRAMARLVHDEGLRLDVATGGELEVALAAGRAGGPAGAARQQQVAGRAAPSAASRRRSDRRGLRRRAGPHRGARRRRACDAPTVLLRINPGIEVHTHEHVRTGNLDSKFGFPLPTGQAHDAVRRARRQHGGRPGGPAPAHRQPGVQRRELPGGPACGGTVRASSTSLAELVVGGGLGVAYLAGEQAPVDHRVGRRHPASAAGTEGIDGDVVSAEPGRAIAAAAAVTLYTVGTIKYIPGVRTYVAVDGGMSDNPRPVLYGSGLRDLPARVRSTLAPRDADPAGRASTASPATCSCARAWCPADLAVGDIIATPGHRCLRPLDGLQLQQGPAPAGGVRAPTARPGWWCAARPSRTCSPPTSADPVAPPHAVLFELDHGNRDPARTQRGRAARRNGGGRLERRGEAVRADGGRGPESSADGVARRSRPMAPACSTSRSKATGSNSRPRRRPRPGAAPAGPRWPARQLVADGLGRPAQVADDLGPGQAVVDEGLGAQRLLGQLRGPGGAGWNGASSGTRRPRCRPRSMTIRQARNSDAASWPTT